MYLPLFCALIEKAVIDSGYKFEHFSKTIPDPLNGVFDFYISGKRSIIKKAGLEKNLRPY